MLIWLTRRFRTRAAIALAAAYCFCVMFPPVSLAFADGAVAAHCLTDDHHSAAHAHGTAGDHGMTHVHADGIAHQHSHDPGAAKGDESGQAKPMGSCCGLFCFVAVTAELDAVGRAPIHASAILPPCTEALAGQGPGRIDRPPSTTSMST